MNTFTSVIMLVLKKVVLNIDLENINVCVVVLSFK